MGWDGWVRFKEELRRTATIRVLRGEVVAGIAADWGGPIPSVGGSETVQLN